jgi:hypothetical protein
MIMTCVNLADSKSDKYCMVLDGKFSLLSHLDMDYTDHLFTTIKKKLFIYLNSIVITYCYNV